ncbi:hypothetical protein ACFQZC_31980 [Streptacidiphilus monticola]
MCAVSPLLRELVAALAEEGDGYPSEERAALQLAAAYQLARAERLPVLLPTPVDDRLRAVAALLHADPGTRARCASSARRWAPANAR